MDYNYHTHTYLCNHADGTMEEYVLKAIDCGIKSMGFSDHIPHKNKNGEEEGHRIPVDKAIDYVNEVNFIKDKYKDKIEILTGFEMEYIPAVFDEMLAYAKELGACYLLCGEHRSIEGAEYNGIANDSVQKLTDYVDAVVEAIETGVFTYVAHPDLINFTGDDEVYKNQMRRICVASTKHNIPLEINFLGIRTNRHYPKEIFWQMAGEEKSPVTFGFDAHDIDGAADLASLERANELVEKYSLNYIGVPKIINI